MKTLHSCAILLLLAALLGAGCKKDSPTQPPETHAGLSFSPGEAAVAVGGALALSLAIGEQADSLFAVSLQLHFADSLLAFADFAGIEAGNFLGTDAVVFAQDSGGVLHVAVSRVQGQTPVSGSGTLCTLHFRGRAPGLCALKILPAELHYYTATGADLPTGQADTVRATVRVN
jgi:hypothetical protein